MKFYCKYLEVLKNDLIYKSSMVEKETQIEKDID